MARRKAAQNCAVKPWLSANGDCREGRYLQVGNSLLLSKRFQALSAGARVTYLAMALESGGRPQFTFPAAAAKKYGVPLRSARRHIGELEENGFISCTSSGKNTRTESLYEFRLDWKNQ